MLTKITLTLAMLLAASTVSAQDSFLGLERFLQAQSSVYASVCTSDSSCSVGNCCATYAKKNGTTSTSVLNTCVSNSLNNKMVLFGGLNHTWTCLNQTTVAATVGTSCNETSSCGNSSCCMSKSFGIWGMNQTLGSTCASNA